MRELYSEDYESDSGGGAARLLPERAKRIAGAVVFAGLIAVMGVWAWRLGTRDASEVPIIRAMEGPSRLQPEDPGGLRAAHQGLEVNAVLAGQPAPAPREAAATTRPVPQVLTQEDTPQGELVLAAPAMLAERVLSEADDLPVPDETAVILGDDATGLGPLAAPDPADDPLQQSAAIEPDPAAAGPRPRNRPRDLAVARAKVETVAAEAKPKPKPEPSAAEPVATREVASARSGARMVQLGAYDSEDMTRRAWSRLVSANPDLLSSKSLYVERTTSNARVFYRLRVAGFDSSDQTRVMCESLRSRGIDCIPVTLQ